MDFAVLRMKPHHKNISMVFQNVYLFPDTIENNIKFGCPNATHEDVVKSAKAARCHDFIFGINICCGLVKNNDGRIFHNRSCNRNPLLFAAGNGRTAFSDYRLVALWQC